MAKDCTVGIRNSIFFSAICGNLQTIMVFKYIYIYIYTFIGLSLPKKMHSENSLRVSNSDSIRSSEGNHFILSGLQWIRSLSRENQLCCGNTPWIAFHSIAKQQRLFFFYAHLHKAALKHNRSIQEKTGEPGEDPRGHRDNLKHYLQLQFRFNFNKNIASSLIPKHSHNFNT